MTSQTDVKRPHTNFADPW